MLDLDCVQQFGNASSTDQLSNCLFRNRSSPFLANATNWNFLHRVAHNLASHTAGPANRRPVEPFALPPLGIPTGGVHCCLEAAGQCLPKLVARHQQTFTMGSASLVEFELLLIRAVIVEPVLRPPSLPFRLQCL